MVLCGCISPQLNAAPTDRYCGDGVPCRTGSDSRNKISQNFPTQKTTEHPVIPSNSYHLGLRPHDYGKTPFGTRDIAIVHTYQNIGTSNVLIQGTGQHSAACFFALYATDGRWFSARWFGVRRARIRFFCLGAFSGVLHLGGFLPETTRPFD